MNETKPMAIEVDEFKQELIKIINDAVRERRIPFFVLEPIMNDFTNQIRNGAKEELQYAKQQIEK